MSRRKFLNLAKTFVPLLLGFFLIYYSLESATEKERQVLWQNILLADFKWVLLSVFLGVLSHLSRAFRWKYLLAPLGYRPDLANSFMAVMAGYLANLGIPRSGEVLRAASISTYEKVPFDKAFGTIVAERIADLLMLLVIVVLTLVFQTDELLGYLEAHNIDPLLSIGIFFVVVLLGTLILRIIKSSKHRHLLKVKEFARGLLDGMRSIIQMDQKKSFVFHTILIWVLYLLMFYVIKFAVPGTTSVSIAGMMAAFIVGTFAISTTNGGIGVYPIAMGAVLLFFKVDQQSGEAFGWIVWGSQTLMIIVVGGLSLLFLPLYNRNK